MMGDGAAEEGTEVKWWPPDGGIRQTTLFSLDSTSRLV